ncbi:AAA ATPase domain-containing protein [Actinacidiphila yanglinensis]|uniref:AAA ATPase domain-containing protein n=1 Tax=Actinacidiphila yanglinensis TaxID=310779 RepID=A0A1H6DK23_9ACTN|nr:serine protease [Actinacidiphila yanglinensis]SEG85608.1 AAA ATPase domain-containing protein [Actinacidiphila yanglinensis]
MDSEWASIVEASQVRVYSSTGEAVGAGFLVDADVVCTCAHVVARALEVPATAEKALGQQVDLDFPLLGGRPRVRATVVSWRFGRADAALLRLDTRPLDTQPVPLVDRTAVRENAFKAFGYPTWADHGFWVWGTLHGEGLGWETQEPGPRNLEGFSGAPVWDGAQGGVVGMMVAANLSESTVYMLPSDALVADEVILKPRCPFKGLSAFREEDVKFFHGRDSDTARVHAVVHRRPVTVVAGPSGCGKSSLVRAGVLPRLRAEGMSVSELRPLPGMPAAAVLGRVLTELLKPELGEVEWPGVAEMLAGLPLEIGHDLAAELRARVLAFGGSAGHVVFIDQLEEYDPWAARDLFGMLAALAGKDGAAALRVVATARPDILDVLVTASNSDLVSEAVCFLAPLSGRDLMRAVTGPVDAVPGLWFEPGLPDRIIADASERPGRMPMVQFALTELWMRRTHSTLTHSAYADMGGVAGAFVAYADGTLEGLTQAQRDCTPRLFAQLVQFGDSDTFSLRPARAADLAPELRHLAWELATHRLVVRSHGADGEEIVDLPHEALIQLWPRLGQWLADYREFRVWQAELRDDFLRWKAQDRGSARLLSGPDLAVALSRLAEHPEDISADERDYILLSRRRSRWRAGRAVHAVSELMKRAAMPMRRGKDSESRPHWQVLAAVGLWLAVLLAAASISVREVLDSLRLHAQLGPSDTPAVVTAIVTLATAIGTLIGVTLTAYAKYVQARGQVEADLIRARAEMMRAEADVTRARAGIPPHDPSATGDPQALTSAELDTSQPPPSGGVT